MFRGEGNYLSSLHNTDLHWILSYPISMFMDRRELSYILVLWDEEWKKSIRNIEGAYGGESSIPIGEKPLSLKEQLLTSFVMNEVFKRSMYSWEDYLFPTMEEECLSLSFSPRSIFCIS